MRGRILVVAACGAWLACAKPPAPAPTAPAPAEAPVAPPPCARAERIEVSKTKRALTVRCVGGAERVFPIALARERGPKRAVGDQRMPEGSYHVVGPPRTSRFSLFIPIDYPSRADADLALKEGRITKEDHAAIVEAHKARRMPPPDTPLGGLIGIHGEGKRWKGDIKLNWTEGCIAMSDEAIAELARMVGVGTPVSIAP